MFDKLEIFRMAMGMASHAAARQNVIAKNVANADTPGYRSQDIRQFSKVYRENNGEIEMRTTRPGHLAAPVADEFRYTPLTTTDPASPNGNSVSLETEMVRAAEVRQEHEMALTIYSTSLNILRTSLGKR